MKNLSMAVLSLAVLAGGWSSTAQAGTTNTFSFDALGGSIGEDFPNLFPLTMDALPAAIDRLDLEIRGLTHPDPMDLDIYLIDPFGTIVLDVITDRGGLLNIVDVNLLMTDVSTRSLVDTAEIVDGDYTPDDPRGFAAFSGLASGPLAWSLLVIDDTVNGSGGSFSGFTLTGSVVPEPATASLLALGAIALIRRSRRAR